MNWLMDLLPTWVPAVILIAMIGLIIFIKVTETHEEPPLPVERAIPVGTFRTWVDIDLLPTDTKALLIGKKIRTELTTLLKSRIWFHGEPHITLRSVSRGSLVFEYAIFIVVTAGALAMLKDYDSMRDGMRALLEDVEKVRQSLYRVAYRVGVKLSRTELSLETDEQFRERARHWTASRAESVRAHATERSDRERPR